ncbi:MAG: trypsin-like peptidase domain-containing protein [Nitrospinae bacterium]|nr:trypsin-like peptidase domain-containing protein [Nitrospinota bacterium]MBL7021319.1 trypsin-like peptidase domain-containing protein [Nitrospinaceae bacterium]
MSFPIDLQQCTSWDKITEKDSKDFTSLEGLYLIQDPFDLRKTILPILAQTNPNLNVWKGLGTAFKVDCFGSLMSAQHVFHGLNKDTPCFAMESPGLGYGTTMPIPKECFTPILTGTYLSYKKDDPMAILQNRPTEKCFYYDVAAIISQPSISINCSTALKINLNRSSISKGDEVMAIGYPHIESLSDINKVYDEKLMCAVGSITEIYETGRSHLSDGEKWPSFQVDSNWPSGMSGGPVFNKDGHVIGVVSRSIQNSNESRGTGNVVALPYCAEKFFADAFPSLDTDNPGSVKGWAIIREEPWELVKIFKDKLQAEKYRSGLSLNSSHHIKYGSNKIGTDDFILL